MSKNRFREQNFHEHQILDDTGASVGRIRIKPNAVLWSPKAGKRWRALSLEQFVEFAEAKGTLPGCRRDLIVKTLTSLNDLGAA